MPNTSKLWFEKWKTSVGKTWMEKRLSTPFEELNFDTKRKVVFYDQNYKCFGCGLSEWLGKPISLELHHIVGDKNNKLRDNFIGLCPNCHSQTKTYRGKNKKSVRNSKEE